MTTKRPIATTGRTHSRMNAGERAALATRLQPFVATESWLANPPSPLEVELGIGNGLAMVERAKANPHIHFLGAEVYLNGLRTLAAAMEKQPLPNLHIYPNDARQLLQSLPPRSIARLLVLFPDPWPKKGHHKRRLVQPQLLDAAAQKLATEGELWVVTDWPSYAYHSIATIFAHRHFMLAPTHLAAADCKPTARLPQPIGPHLLGEAPSWWQPTKYQQKAQLAGRATWYIKALNLS